MKYVLKWFKKLRQVLSHPEMRAVGVFLVGLVMAYCELMLCKMDLINLFTLGILLFVTLIATFGLMKQVNH